MRLRILNMPVLIQCRLAIPYKSPGQLRQQGIARAVAVGVLRDSSPVIAGGDGSVQVWQLADDTPLAHSLNLPEPSWIVALRGNIIVTAGGRDIGIHRPGAP